MKVALGVDHAGFPLKKELETALRAFGASVVDMGTSSDASCDYPEFAERVASAVASGEVDRGVLVCGTGIGMSIAANKIAGIRAAVVTDETTAELSRRHNDANVFCAGARILPVLKIAEALKVWLQTPFEGGRHLRRIEKISRLEQRP
ncbi:MAG TPA: ribose 5-phosphate isomerase B [Planctomycetota bacterium]|nr:ribose 5-phosphate isomerase B [Planctomycetota bacterium]